MAKFTFIASDDFISTDTIGEIVVEPAPDHTDGAVYAAAAKSEAGDVSNLVVPGDDGNNTLYGGAGSDTISGAGGNDLLFGDNGSTNPDEAAGSSDTLFDGTGNDTLFGEGGDDSLQGLNGTDTFYGGGGNDTINSGEGDDDLVYGGSGDDMLIGVDTAYGGSGNDFIDGGVSAGTGQDVLYGDAGDDTLMGRNSSDTLYGGTGIDSLDAGSGNDVVYAGTDTTSGSETTISAWNGESGSPAIDIVVAAGSHFNLDIVYGGSESGDPENDPDSNYGVQDVLIMDMDPGAPRNVLTYTALGSGQVVLADVEAIVGTLGADLINLTYIAGGTGIAYAGSVLINASYGNDMVFSGSGNDTIVGDSFFPLVGRTPGDDLLYGGSGNDAIYGDFVNNILGGNESGGSDTLYGGFGTDTLYGGAGDDKIYDSDGAHAYGGLGADLLILHYFNGGEFSVAAGSEDGGDGNDTVVISGIFDTIHGSLGAGDDIYISGVFLENSEGGSGTLTDIVDGGSGSDMISTYFGRDTLFGGEGDDVLWGGNGTSEGGDVMYGGADTDVLYLTEGKDVAYGGLGSDYYYVAVVSDHGQIPGGGADEIYDLARLGEDPDGTTNYIVLFSDFDTEEVPSSDEPNPDFLLNGFGIVQPTHDLVNPDPDAGDLLSLVDNGDGTFTILTFFSDGFALTFHHDDIATIVLWNNDAVNPSAGYPEGTPVMTFYNWDDTAQTYIYSLTPH